MKKIIQFIRKREFLKFFLMFFSGTLVAQIITVAISPLLTRIYTPENFGLYGVYLSIISLLIVFVTGRYEFAINNADSEEDAYSLYRIIIYLSSFTSGFSFIIIFFFADSIIDVFRLDIKVYILYFIPLTLLLMGFLQGSSYYLNRHKKFSVLSKSKIYRSVGNGTISIASGLINLGAIGLIIGNIFAILISQTYQRILGIRRKKYKVDRKRIIKNIIKYKHYPLYNVPSAFFDNLAIQAPVFILLKFFSEAIVGFYSLTARVIGMPLSLISTSISQVFLSKVSELHRKNESYRGVIIKIAIYLAIIGLAPLIIISYYGPSLFIFIFGEEWKVAGEYAQILTIGYFFKFVISPLSVVFFINQQVRLLSIVQFSRAISTTVILFSTSMFFEVSTVLIAYTIHESIFYIIYFYFILKTSKK